jgi:hypothetical protein
MALENLPDDLAFRNRFEAIVSQGHAQAHDAIEIRGIDVRTGIGAIKRDLLNAALDAILFLGIQAGNEGKAKGA